MCYQRLPFEFFATRWPRSAFVELARQQLAGEGSPQYFVLELIRPGAFYAITPARVVEVEAVPKPDVVLCRRRADFQVGHRFLPGTTFERCERCGAEVVVSESAARGVPRRCLQCAGFSPARRSS